MTIARCIAITALAVAAMAAVAAAAKPEPPQLNVTSFAACLQDGRPVFDVQDEVKAFGLSKNDLLIVYLSVYAGERLPIVNTTLQQPAFEKWGVAFWERESVFVETLKRQAHNDSVKAITPGMTFQWALDACGYDNGPQGHPFCASLLQHNVYRTLGRYMKNIDKHGVNYNPTWFRSNRSDWINVQIPAIHAKLVSLRRDNNTEKWGEWYHTFGLATYGVDVMGVMGMSGGESWEKFVVFMDTLLNPILAGGAEDPVKAEIDKQTVALAYNFLQLQQQKPVPKPTAGLCETRQGYVLQPWST
eukprot:TRINITY_DN66349_c5_g8_i1.p2 TRINITY_DN66349_c5_g8~~TRINITY_DN66349_c5_g8_i1.p2  ORF type:complete len:302 (+),score=153.73 TRINITY_DN66349_c5_g8_i1:1-906(+)